MLKIRNIFLLLLLAASVLFAQTIRVDNIVGNGQVLVPVTVSGAPLINVKSFTLQFSYDNTCVTFNHNNQIVYSGIRNFVLPGQENLEKLFVSVNNGLISISWMNPSSTLGASFNDKIFDLDFSYLQSFSEIRFVSAVVKDMMGNRLPVNKVHGSISSSSDAAVKIIYPNGGETLEVVGAPANITWTSIHITNVNIYYSTNNGADWNTIVEDIDAVRNSYQWTLPSTINSADCKIRIKEVYEPSASDESDAVFTINSVPVITLLSPDGGEELKVGGAKFIKWTSRNIQNIKLEYCTNASAPSPAWQVISHSLLAGTNSFEWTIPNSISTDCKVRISDAGNPVINDISNAIFKIHNDPVNVSVAKVVEAKVDIIGIVVGLNFHWWDDSTHDWHVTPAHYEKKGIIYDAVDTLRVLGTVPVSVGWLTAVKYLEMHLSYNPDILLPEEIIPAVEQLRPINYSHEDGVIDIIWGTNEPLDVHGKIFDLKFRYVKFDKPFQWLTLDKLPPFDLLNPESDPSIVPSDIDPQNFSDIKITKVDIKNSLNNLIDASSWSNGSLAISNKRTIKILSPSVNEVLERNDRTYNILWSSLGVVNVAIDYSTDNGSNWTSIIASTTSSPGIYPWQLPDVNSTTCKIKITSADNQVQYISEPFTVTNVKQLNLLSPNGGEVLKVGALKNIAWSCTNVDKIKLEYSTGDDAGWNLIIDNVPAKQYKYAWTIPNVSSANCRVRISEAGVPSKEDISASAFTINNTPAKISISNVIGINSGFTVVVNSELVSSAAFFSLSIRYNAAVMKFVKAAAKPVIGSGYFTCSSGDGIIHIMWSCKIPVDLSGDLFTLKFKDYTFENSAIEFDTPNTVRDITTKEINIEFVSGGVSIRNGINTQRFSKKTTEGEKNIPDRYDLLQNYPNPFNPITTIKYAIPRESQVLVAIYNMLGERIVTLVDERKEPGFYEAVWDADKFASGIYYYSIVTKEFNETKKMILLK